MILQTTFEILSSYYEILSSYYLEYWIGFLSSYYEILSTYYPEYWIGFLTTLTVSTLSLFGSLLLGFFIATLCVSPYQVTRFLGRAWVEFIRNTPVLIQVFFFYYGLPSLNFSINAFTAGTLGLTVYTSAFIAEAIRAGILSVPLGQTEAARSAGLTYVQTMFYIILPQAFRIVLPAIGNQFLNLVKNSSILSVIAGMDLMYHADLIASKTFHVFETYFIVACFYLLLTIPLSFFVNWLERH